MKETILILIFTALLLYFFSDSIYKYDDKRESVSDDKQKVVETTSIGDIVPQVGGFDFNEPFPVNTELEEVYINQFAYLPKHHTVCFPVKKYYCTAEKCEVSDPVVFNLIGKDGLSATISRCDNKPCDTYSAIMDDSGVYKIIQPEPGKGMLFKMSYNTIDKKYVEIATLGIDTFISYGYCKYDYEFK